MPIFKWLEKQEWIFLIADNWLILGIFSLQTKKLFPGDDGIIVLTDRNPTQVCWVVVGKILFFLVKILFVFVFDFTDTKKSHKAGICYLCSYRALLHFIISFTVLQRCSFWMCGACWSSDAGGQGSGETCTPSFCKILQNFQFERTPCNAWLLRCTVHRIIGS